VKSSGTSGVPDPTLSHYERNAGRITEYYETVDLTATLSRLAAYLPSGARVLEIGAGSGRDAAWLLAQGFDVTAVDGSQAMAERAGRLHPELSGRIRVVRLPAALPFGDDVFDGVISFATIMHLPADAIGRVLAECRRVLRPDGTLAVSVPTARADLDAHGFDVRGRRFTVYDEAAWNEQLASAGFRVREAWSSADAAGRAGIRWYTAIVSRNASEERSDFGTRHTG
jgi:SAM-dependent methyltransferase